MAFTQVNVTQPYGTGATGTVTFLLDRLISNGGDAAGGGASVIATLDGSGNITVTLPSNEDAGTRPVGSRWRVHERIDGRTQRIYYVSIPAVSAVALDSLAKADDSAAAVMPTVATDRYLMAAAPGQQRRALTMNREMAQGSGTVTSGRVHLTAFTWEAPDLAISSLSAFVRGTAAATITLARLGLYTVSQDGSVALVARTAASTTLGNSTFSNANAALDTVGGYPASYTLRQGVRYAIGAIWVATTPPALYACPGNVIANAFLPWIAMGISSQSDLPTSIAIGALGADSNVWFLGAY